uniref:Uncharacterized protein n=1 Tax=Tanacetum cinerariifolium TaxID=118510 RepID=A0A699H0E1_TANCI|nr:hypothetical protein [Tanacetum cinerariifolium]
MESSTHPITTLSGTDAKYLVDQTSSTRFKVSVPDQHQSKTSYEVELDSHPLVLLTAADVQALLLYDDELVEESDSDILEAGDEMDEDIQKTDEEETQSLNPFKDSSTEVATEKGTEAAFSHYEKLLIQFSKQTRKNVNQILSSLKEIQDVIKEDTALNKKV